MIKTLIIVALATYLTRILPSLILKDHHLNENLEQLISNLPYASIGLLVVYSFKDVNLGSLWPTLIASTICIASYVWKRNSIISILLSTIIYMVLI